MYNIGAKIRKYREAQRMTQKELADQLGISVTRLSNWEVGIHRPDADHLADLCRALNTSPSILLDVHLTDRDFTEQEFALIEAYRNKPEMQHAVNILLGIERND